MATTLNILVLAKILVVLSTTSTVEAEGSHDVYQGCGEGIEGKQKLCAGIYGKNCVKSKSCDFAGTVTENSTHFEIVLVSGARDDDKKFDYSLVASVSPLEKLVANVKPKCKASLSIKDFQFRIFRANKIRTNEEQIFTSSSGTFMTHVEKFGWATNCQQILEKYVNNQTTFPWLNIVINDYYFSALMGETMHGVKNKTEFRDPKLYRTDDQFLYLNFDNTNTDIATGSATSLALRLTFLFILAAVGHIL